MKRNLVVSALWVGCGVALLGCSSKSGNSNRYPLVKPPVQAAAPVAFGGQATVKRAKPEGPGHVLPMALSVPDVATRFFGAGPTDVYNILGTIDNAIAGVNSSGGSAACLTQTPVAYTISPWGESVTMYAQCYELDVDGASLMQWGVNAGVFYLFQVGGQELTAVIATPVGGAAIPGSDGGAVLSIDGGLVPDAAGIVGATYSVHAWIGLGMANTTNGCPNGTGWDNCSYGVMELEADPSASSFELAVAGVGFGYCGAQIASDGTNIFAKGSSDMGSTCNAADTLCVAASDGTTTATCTAAEQAFALPPLGRMAGTGTGTGAAGVTAFAASLYPGGAGDTITLDGTTGDSIHFGPTTPTAGVGRYH